MPLSRKSTRGPLSSVLRWVGLSMLLICQMGTSSWQVIAWMGMVVDYSYENASVTKGIEETFSGEKPCGLCHAIDETEKEDSKQNKTKHKTKVETELSKAEPIDRVTLIKGMALVRKESFSPSSKTFHQQFYREIQPPIPISRV